MTVRWLWKKLYEKWLWPDSDYADMLHLTSWMQTHARIALDRATARLFWWGWTIRYEMKRLISHDDGELLTKVFLVPETTLKKDFSIRSRNLVISFFFNSLLIISDWRLFRAFPNDVSDYANARKKTAMWIVCTFSTFQRKYTILLFCRQRWWARKLTIKKYCKKIGCWYELQTKNRESLRKIFIALKLINQSLSRARVPLKGKSHLNSCTIVWNYLLSSRGLVSRLGRCSR